MPILISKSGHPTTFVRTPLQSATYDEKWLQKWLFDAPELLIAESGERPVIPICRELPLSGPGSKVFLDLFCVRDDGKPVLVECKLWRNPQARREVIGQILEYASLLQGLTFSDLEAIVGPKLSVDGPNPIFQAAQSVRPELIEEDFVDACHGYLARGEFDLIIAGDGIRSGLTGIKDLLESRGGLASRLRLVEVGIFESEQGDVLVQSRVQAKTQTIRVTVGSLDQAANTETAFIDESITSSNTEPNAWREQSKKFWRRFIEELHLEHPDQGPPKPFGSWNVRLPFPKPGLHIGCWREKGENTLGVFFRCEDSDDGRELYKRLVDDLSSLEKEVGHPLAYADHDDYSSKPFISLRYREFQVDAADQEAAQLEFLKAHVNRFVNALRRRIP